MASIDLRTASQLKQFKSTVLVFRRVKPVCHHHAHTPRTGLSEAYGSFKRAASPEDTVRARGRVFAARERVSALCEAPAPSEASQSTPRTGLSQAYSEFRRAASPEDTTRARGRVFAARDRVATADAQVAIDTPGGYLNKALVAASTSDSPEYLLRMVVLAEGQVRLNQHNSKYGEVLRDSAIPWEFRTTKPYHGVIYDLDEVPTGSKGNPPQKYQSERYQNEQYNR